MAQVAVTTWSDVRDTYRRKDLRQAMYDDGAVVMADCLLNLHGAAHRDRRRLENRLFRLETFQHWERDVLGPTIDAAMGPFVAAGHGDLITIGYRTTMDLTAHIAGIDRPPPEQRSNDDTERLLAIVRVLSAGATMVHSTRDPDELQAEVAAALEVLEVEHLDPSVARRQALIDAVEAGRADAATLPRDVLTTLLRARDDLALDRDAIAREIAFYLQAGSHSSANAFTHALDELFTAGPAVVDRARTDPLYRQRCVHETLRLHPASSVAWRRVTCPTRLADGSKADEGDLVVIELLAANTDPEVWGDHACIGAELDSGLDPRGARPPDDDHLYGTVAVMVGALLDAGGRPDPDHPPVPDGASSRPNFSAYPVVITAPEGDR